MAEIWADTGRLPQAEAALREVIPLATGHLQARAMANLGVCLRRRAQFTEAEMVRQLAALRTGAATPAEVLTTLAPLLARPLYEPLQAHLHETLWQLDTSRQPDREAAARLYRDLYAKGPRPEFRSRYRALTGQVLPTLHNSIRFRVRDRLAPSPWTSSTGFWMR